MIQKETREDQYKGKEKKGNTREKEQVGKIEKKVNLIKGDEKKRE